MICRIHILYINRLCTTGCAAADPRSASSSPRHPVHHLITMIVLITKNCFWLACFVADRTEASSVPDTTFSTHSLILILFARSGHLAFSENGEHHALHQIELFPRLTF